MRGPGLECAGTPADVQLDRTENLLVTLDGHTNGC